MKKLKKIISLKVKQFFVYCLILLTIFITGSNSDSHAVQIGNISKISLDNMKVIDGLPNDVNLNVVDRQTFSVDFDYLKSTGVPDDVIKDVKYASTPLIVNAKDCVLYFVYSDIMTSFGTQKYKIYSVNKENNMSSCIYQSNDSVFKETLSGVVVNNVLYWSECLYQTDKIGWNLCCIDLNTNEFSVICNDIEINSEIIPILSCDSSNIYWYSVNDNKYNLMCYNVTNKTFEIKFEDIVCNNPYTRYFSTNNSSCVLKKGKFVYGDISLAPVSSELIASFASSDKYIVWVQLPQEDTYINQTMYIYNVETQETLYVNEEELNGNILGCGILNDYIYINISNGSEEYNGMYLFDFENNIKYNLKSSLNNEISFSCPIILEDESIFFYGEKIYQIS